MSSSASARLWVVALASCNAIYGIHDVEQTPATVYDAPIDAPFTCPPIGTAPKFSVIYHQQFVQQCHDYTVLPSGAAFAACTDVAGVERPSLGVAGAPLEPLPIDPSMSFSNYIEARITTDGNHIVTSVPITYPDQMFERSGSGWVEIAPPPNFERLSTFAAVPDGQLVFDRGTFGTNPREWHYDGTWHEVVPSALQITVAQSITLSTNGLRAIVVASDGTYYTDRPDTTSQFRPLELMYKSPYAVNAPFLSDDCARIYMTGLDTVGYIQQQ